MKRSLYWITVCLLIALLTAALTGCGGAGAGGEQSPETQPVSEESAVGEQASPTDGKQASENPPPVSKPASDERPTSQTVWSVIGSVGGSSWDRDFPLEETAAGVFTLSIELKAGDELKVRRNGSWDLNYGVFGMVDGDNAVAPESGRYTVQLSFPDGKDAELELIPEWKNSCWSVIGSVCGSDWDVDFPMEELGGGVYSLDMELYAGEELKVRKDRSWDVNYGEGGLQDGANLVVPENGMYTVRLTVPNGGAAKLELVPTPSAVPESSGWSVIGSINGSSWDRDFPMHRVSDGHFESDRLTLHAGEELKIRKDGSWDLNYGESGIRDGDNIQVRSDGQYYVLLALHDGDRQPSVELLPVPFSRLAGTIRELEKELEAKYPVRIYIDPVQLNFGNCRFDPYKAEPMTVCRILLDLKEFFDSLPPGMMTEIHDGTSAVPEPSGTKIVPGGRFRIIIVRSWHDDIGAMAFAIENNMSAFFCTEQYMYGHIPHEFGHLIDGRLRMILTGLGRDPEAEWLALSPREAYDRSRMSWDEAADYFVTDASREDTWEDKTWIFTSLYLSSEPLDEAFWYKDHPGIQAKAAYLTQTLREVFPSVQAVDRAVWERR